MSKPTVTLYYATWCGHCQDFKAEWDKLKNSKTDATFEEYEDGQDKAKMEADNIRGYPTIKITKGGKCVEYNGNRTAKDIIYFLTNGMNAAQDRQKGKKNLAEQDAEFDQCGGLNQCGGSRNKKSKRITDDDKYKIKYLKYKAKYMKLRGQ